MLGIEREERLKTQHAVECRYGDRMKYEERHSVSVSALFDQGFDASRPDARVR
jgi:hypothetical protein